MEITIQQLKSIGYMEDPTGRMYHKDNGAVNIIKDVDGGYLIYILGAEVSKSHTFEDLSERTKKYVQEFDHLKR